MNVHIVIFYDTCLKILDTMPGDTSLVLTGAADNSARLWDCETGTELARYDTNSAVRTCGFSSIGNYLMYSTDAAMKNICEIILYDVRDKASAPIRYVVLSYYFLIE